ncbi:sugar ABC transporter permease [Nocardioides sp. Soil774]|uniref:sugar ABC transporter permease n=1 Tax=Nocardioides sp. Soil774 TaxID=1736408 RepID=UPI0009E6A074|nr:hypothetical protein [Nocardioides sp. Soil774]
MSVQSAVTRKPGGTPVPTTDGPRAGRSGGAWIRALFARRPSGINLAPVLLGLVVVCVGFQTANSNFLTPWNLTNLSLQVASVGVIAVGVVVILLLGEIDLSVAAISGFCGAVLGVLNVQLGWNAWLSIVVAVSVGIAIGTFQGTVVTYFRVPAFVITLAGLIGLQGWTLALFGDRTAINFDYDGDVAKLTATFLSPLAGWLIAIGATAALAYFTLAERARLKAAGLEHSDLRTQVLKLVGIAVGLGGAVAVFNRDRGVPLAVFIFVGIVVVMDYVVRQTRFGVRLLAIGGNAEAARRAGIPVQRIRIAAFAIGSGLAAFGGVLAASRLIAATTQSGAGDTLINAIAAAVIGGTSLFGGRGSVYSALVGILIIGSISNGMDLLALPSAAKFIITSMVLLLAVVVDAIAARGSRSQLRE